MKANWKELKILGIMLVLWLSGPALALPSILVINIVLGIKRLPPSSFWHFGGPGIHPHK